MTALVLAHLFKSSLLLGVLEFEADRRTFAGLD